MDLIRNEMLSPKSRGEQWISTVLVYSQLFMASALHSENSRQLSTVKQIARSIFLQRLPGS